MSKISSGGTKSSRVRIPFILVERRFGYHPIKLSILSPLASMTRAEPIGPYSDGTLNGMLNYDWTILLEKYPISLNKHTYYHNPY